MERSSTPASRWPGDDRQIGHELDIPPLGTRDYSLWLAEVLVANETKTAALKVEKGKRAVVRKSAQKIGYSVLKQRVLPPVTSIERHGISKASKSTTAKNQVGRRDVLTPKLMDMRQVDSMIEANFRLGIGPVSIPKIRREDQ